MGVRYILRKEFKGKDREKQRECGIGICRHTHNSQVFVITTSLVTTNLQTGFHYIDRMAS